MATNNSTQISELTKDEAEKIAIKLETMYHSITSIYDLSMDAMQKQDPSYLLVAIKDMARSCARDLEACAEKLSGSEIGYFEAKFGPIS